MLGNWGKAQEPSFLGMKKEVDRGLLALLYMRRGSEVRWEELSVMAMCWVAIVEVIGERS